MNKKLQNLALIMAIISCLTLLFALMGPVIYKSNGSTNNFLFQIISFVSSFGKLGLTVNGLNQNNYAFFSGGFLTHLIMNFFAIIISIIVFIGSFQFITSKGKMGIKSIKFGLVIISCNCILAFLSSCVHFYNIMTPSKFVSDSQNQTNAFFYLISSAALFIYTLYFNNSIKKLEAETGFETEPNGSSIFNDETPLPNYEQTTTKFRFFNYLTDFVVILIMSFNILGLVFSVILFAQAIKNDGYPARSNLFDNDNYIKLLIFLSYSFFSIIYYTFFEKVFGYTAGKALTNTKVINEAGNGISMGQAFGRTFSRFVPFEMLSAFSCSMWHDNWTNTYTVDVPKANFNNNINA